MSEFEELNDLICEHELLARRMRVLFVRLNIQRMRDDQKALLKVPNNRFPQIPSEEIEREWKAD